MVVFFKSVALAALTFLATVGDAHMIMKTPVPYGKSTLNNSPLVADGSDFPCKQRSGVYDAEGASNVAAIGEPQTLSFIGSATHGGGSCQVSLTTDLQPSKNSKWMVIKSIEGGCPASAPGNIGDDPNGSGASTFQFSVPEGIAPGEYTMAWTWFNKVGNREMYMNCAPFTVTSAKKKRYMPAPKASKRQTSFPDMFVANLAAINTCTTPESFDYVFPNPGADVQSAGSGPYTTLSCGSNGNNAPQQPTGSIPVVSGTATAAPTSYAAGPPSSAPAFASGNAGQYTASPPASAVPGNFASGASSVPTSAVVPSSTVTDLPQVVPTTIPAGAGSSIAPSNTAAATALAATPTSSSSAASNSSAAGALTGPCSNEGFWNCIDGNSFQRCASGSWSAVIPMNGMKCSPGISSDFSMTAANAKRWEA
ncbi:uncharacterized protein Z519_08478 [Cladophialophora bantiana CBS 173.52]|uniref:DNA-directed RNA polymerase n=1 Tax=Cladophialophora bantiana (strain ATCC 10958 / CBS 173.52 / CDC B-1940 / NIH 8579) TaxID=1442370 RepID=A0A0D2HIW6_CLAB1|nr:uncharacterized protein Z519_08478 [Cladophialophora bantiana CBS 173.52]KIW90695.1 hypothetical protein Z519_08478 [Cladophialophora bantiana CBS 173.52]